MKTKLLFALLVFSLVFASGLFGQESFFTQNTMTIFKGDIDKLSDVNDYGDVKLKNVFLFSGARYVNGAIDGFQGGFATYFGKLYFAMFYEGNFWKGYENTHTVGGREQDVFGADTGITLDNNFQVMFGNEKIGGIAIRLGFDKLGFNKDVNDTPPATEVNTRTGNINFGALWGKNFAGSSGTFKPELGFLVNINMDKQVRKSGGTTTFDGGYGPSSLALNLSAEYLFAKEGRYQTTLSFGDIPLFNFKYDAQYKPAKDTRNGTIFNTLFGEVKQVYDISASLSLGYLVGINLAINGTSEIKKVDAFEFGILPRVSFGLAYKANDKFTFNTGVRLGSLRPNISSVDNVGNSTNDDFGFFYRNIKDKRGAATVEDSTWYYLPFQGVWGLGLLWQPEELFSADFSVDSKLNNSGAFNFNVLFTLNL